MSALGELCEGWDKVIDPCVFGKNGMRMIWNRKASTCKVCNGVPFQKWISEKRRRCKGERGRAAAEAIVQRPDIEPCRACNTFDNKIDEGRPYDPIAMIDCENPEEEFRRLENPILALELTSIRLTISEERPTIEVTPFELPNGLLKFIEPWRKKTLQSINQMRAPVANNGGIKRKREDDKTSTSLLPVSVGDNAYRVLSEYVTSVHHCGILSIKTDEFKHFFLVNTTSHECRNKGGSHGRSTIYLVFQPDGYYQKCWCRKGEIYRAGGVSCAQYRSPLIQYVAGDVSEIRQLFSARFARQFPFTFGQTPTPAPHSAPQGPCFSSTLQLGGAQSNAPMLVDSYPELKGRKFSEVKKIIEERMQAWRAAQTEGKERDEKRSKK